METLLCIIHFGNSPIPLSYFLGGEQVANDYAKETELKSNRCLASSTRSDTIVIITSESPPQGELVTRTTDGISETHSPSETVLCCNY